LPGDKIVTPTTIIDNEFATLLYHDDKKIVHHTWKKAIAGEPFRSVLLSGVDLLKKHGAHKWLSDDRGMEKPLSDEDTVWSQAEWFPRAKEAGWQYWALVVPPDVKSRINLSEFVFNYSQQGLRVAVFTQPEEAMKWLETL
jgi:hypothetical protein